MTLLACIMGTGNSGKSTFLKWVKERRPQTGLIEIGKILRAKYPPDYFKGQAAPKHTAVEAWQMFLDELVINVSSGVDLILCDGQPRDYEQTLKMLKIDEEFDIKVVYILFDCFKDERSRRLSLRFQDDSESLKLGMDRINNDMISNYVVLVELLKANVSLIVVDTNGPIESYAPNLLGELNELLCWCGTK